MVFWLEQCLHVSLSSTFCIDRLLAQKLVRSLNVLVVRLGAVPFAENSVNKPFQFPPAAERAARRTLVRVCVSVVW
jgi:hypothetical protein